MANKTPKLSILTGESYVDKSWQNSEGSMQSGNKLSPMKSRQCCFSFSPPTISRLYKIYQHCQCWNERWRRRFSLLVVCPFKISDRFLMQRGGKEHPLSGLRTKEKLSSIIIQSFFKNFPNMSIIIIHRKFWESQFTKVIAPRWDYL